MACALGLSIQLNIKFNNGIPKFSYTKYPLNGILKKLDACNFDVNN